MSSGINWGMVELIVIIVFLLGMPLVFVMTTAALSFLNKKGR